MSGSSIDPGTAHEVFAVLEALLLCGLLQSPAVLAVKSACSDSVLRRLTDDRPTPLAALPSWDALEATLLRVETGRCALVLAFERRDTLAALLQSSRTVVVAVAVTASARAGLPGLAAPHGTAVAFCFSAGCPDGLRKRCAVLQRACSLGFFGPERALLMRLHVDS